MYQSSPLSFLFTIFSDVTLNVGHWKGYFADIFPLHFFLCARSTEAQQSTYMWKLATGWGQFPDVSDYSPFSIAISYGLTTLSKPDNLLRKDVSVIFMFAWFHYKYQNNSR
jgi:hypothetical protein